MGLRLVEDGIAHGISLGSAMKEGAVVKAVLIDSVGFDNTSVSQHRVVDLRGLVFDISVSFCALELTSAKLHNGFHTDN